VASNWHDSSMMEVRLRAQQDPTFDALESRFPDLGCAFLVFLYLVLAQGIVIWETLPPFVDLFRESTVYGLIEARSDACFSAARDLSVSAGLAPELDETEFVEGEIFVYYACVSDSEATDVRERAVKRSVGAFVLLERYRDLFFASQHGHVIPVTRRAAMKPVLKVLRLQFAIADTSNEHIQRAQPQKKIQMGQLPRNTPVTHPAARQEWDAAGSLQDVGAYRHFFELYAAVQTLPLRHVILVWYDIETTTTMKSQALGSKFDMAAYLIVAQIQLVGRHLELPELLAREQVFAGGRCVQEFVSYVRELVMWCYRCAGGSPKVQLLAWNGRKFDSQFLMAEIINACALDFELVGTPSNPKVMSFGGIASLLDARDMVGGGSLQSFAQSMGVAGKLNAHEALSIDSLAKWERSEPEFRLRVIDYCRQDVTCMREAVGAFNRLIVDLLYEFRGASLAAEDPDVPLWVLKPTIAKLSYDLFVRYLTLPGLHVGANCARDCHEVVRASYRGGYVQPLVFGMFTARPGRKLWYLDINSLYPSVMCSGRLPTCMASALSLAGTRVEVEATSLSLDPFAIYELIRFDLGPDAQYGWFPVPVKQGPEVKKVYVRTFEDREAPLWVWGVELIAALSTLRGAIFILRRKLDCTDSSRLLRAAGVLYTERLRAKREKKDAKAATLKFMMNNVYGRFGMKTYEQSFFMLTRDQLGALSAEDYDVLVAQRQASILQSQGLTLRDAAKLRLNLQPIADDMDLAKFTCLRPEEYLPVRAEQRITHVASFIASKARVQLLTTMYRLVAGADRRICYCDTDSIVVDAPDSFEPARDIVRTSYLPRRDTQCRNIGEDAYVTAGCHAETLGDLKVEYAGLEAIQVFGAKFYRYRHGGRWHIKTKGVFFRAHEDEVERLRAEEERFAHAQYDALTDVLQQRKGEDLFDDFARNLSARIPQQSIRKGRKRMQVVASDKRLQFVLTRELLPGKGLGYNETRPFESVAAYLAKASMTVAWNAAEGGYVYKERPPTSADL